MRVVFRTDASTQVGSGHVMRCLTLGEKLRAKGADVLFICREHDGNLNDLIEKKGFEVGRLPAPAKSFPSYPSDVRHASWLGLSWEEDAEDTRTAMGGSFPEWLIVDHYALDRKWEERLREYVGKIMIIDDLADRSHDCDLLLDQNLYKFMESRYLNLIPQRSIQLLGPKYALVRSEFSAARERIRRWEGSVNRVLVFFGGIDSTNETQKTVDALISIKNRSFGVDVVVGEGNPRKDQIREICSDISNVRFHCQVSNMAELMAAADLSFGAGGTATWERCCAYLPAIITVVARNQLEIARSVHDFGAAYYLGLAAEVSASDIKRCLKTVLDDKSSIKRMADLAGALVDGQGTSRVAAALERKK